MLQDKLLHGVLLAAVLTSAGRGYASTVTFGDSTFSPASYTTVVVLDVLGAGTHAESQVLTGGNPGSYWRVEQSGYGDWGDLLLAFVLQGAVYNPAVSGPIVSVDLHMEAVAPDADLVKPPNSLDFNILLTQNGKYYISYQGIASLDTNWVGVTRTGLVSDSFRTLGTFPSESPDFSSAGGPIGFGFATFTHNPVACDSPCNVGGIDNWSVTINPPDTTANTPEPATWAGMLVASLALGSCYRRRSSRP